MELIWDFDGTLFDTYPLMARAFRQALLAEGWDVPEKEIRSHMEVSMGHTIAHYREKCGISDKTLDNYKMLQRLEGAGGAAPFPHVQEICARVCAQGGMNHLCTHRGATAQEYLEEYNMTRYFGIMVTGQSGFPRKPAPDGINYILSQTKRDKAHFVMLGDRELDIQAAHHAGIRACMFTNGADGVVTQAEYILKAYEDFFNVI